MPCSARSGPAPRRWLLALTGFATVAFGGYLLIQLYTVTQTSDSMIFLDKGPGLYICTAGAAIVFSTIFLPMPQHPSAAEPSAIPTSRDWYRGRVAGLLAAVSSPWRYPAALLAVVAGLAHVPVTPEHLNEAPYIGVLFIVLTVVCVVLARPCWSRTRPRCGRRSAAPACSPSVAFVLSRTVGLPLIGDDIGNWLRPSASSPLVTEYEWRSYLGRCHAAA